MTVPWRVAADAGSSEEEILVRRAGEGDRAAFGSLYERYTRMVHGILLARVPVEDAEDLVQDVFVAAMRQLGSLRSPAAFPGWLASIARNRANDFHRGALPRGELRDAAARGPGDEAALILDAVRRLPRAYRETLILRFVEGMTGPEIAARTGLTHDSVRVNLSRGMKLLRESYGGDQRHA